MWQVGRQPACQGFSASCCQHSLANRACETQGALRPRRASYEARRTPLGGPCMQETSRRAGDHHAKRPLGTRKGDQGEPTEARTGQAGPCRTRTAPPRAAQRCSGICACRENVIKGVEINQPTLHQERKERESERERERAREGAREIKLYIAKNF